MHTIDRFTILDLLGSGTQGKVYRCRDTKLQREVAIKLMHTPLLHRGAKDQELLNEARAMSQFNHPNVVSVFDVGDYQDRPYLVFELIRGRDLSEILKREPPSQAAALNILQGVLEGVAEAHAHDIVHRDLKPSNIIVTQGGVPKVTDFGISAVLRNPPQAGEKLVGTPRYMAPEYIQHGQVMKQTDVFALGLIAYEIFAGRPAFEGRSVEALLQDIISRPVRPLDSIYPDFDPRLQKLIGRAMEKNPYLRFTDAGEMRDALLEYRKAASTTEVAAESHSTVQFLLRRIRLQNDFPALAQSISTLNQLGVSDLQDTSELANIIVKDYGLTNKILKVVNSAYYAAFSGTIGTISRAIVILGVNGVRSIASSLALLEHFGNKPGMEHLRDMLSESLFSALSARDISQAVDPSLGEEALLATMLRRLGNLLVGFYLPEEEQEVRRLVETEQSEQRRAEIEVLGTTYEHIARVIAKEWNFPVEIRQCIQPLKELPRKRVMERGQRLQLLTNLADEATGILRGKKSDQAKQQLRKLLDNYGGMLGVEPASIIQSLGNAKGEYLQFKVNFADQKQKQQFIESLNPTDGRAAEPFQVTTQVAPQNHRNPTRELTVNIDETGTIEAHVSGRLDREQMLTEGMQEVTQMLMNGHESRQLINLVLEILYRGMHFSHIVAGIWNPRSKEIVGAAGMGKDAEKLAGSFRLRTSGPPNLFTLALIQNSDVYIRDATQARVAQKAPPWFGKVTQPGSFFVLPLRTGDKTLGMLYAEYELPYGFDENPKVLHLMQALRNQLVLGLR